MEEIIRVGILTEGEPEIEVVEDSEGINGGRPLTRLKNMLIGKGFHWQRTIEVLLPGDVIVIPAGLVPEGTGGMSKSSERAGGVPKSAEGGRDAGEFRVINRVPVETYLECVVGSEMNPEAPAEFLKAHAVISRSWVMGKIAGLHHADSNGKVNRPDLLIDWDDTSDHKSTNTRQHTTTDPLTITDQLNNPDQNIKASQFATQSKNAGDGNDMYEVDVCSDDHCQRYQGIQPIPESIREALRATRGLVLREGKGEADAETSSGGGIVDARFSKCCGGRTELFSSCWQPCDVACLESFEDPWCDLSGLSPVVRRSVLSSILKDYDLLNDGGYEWTATVSGREIEENLSRKFGRSVGRITGIRPVSYGASGRITALRVTGTDGELVIGKELMIRRLLAPTHLYSSWFTINRINDNHGFPTLAGPNETATPSNEANTRMREVFTPTNEDGAERDGVRFMLHGRGWGHGVGLCQIGAAHMALAGHDFRSILSFYYPGSRLE